MKLLAQVLKCIAPVVHRRQPDLMRVVIDLRVYLAG